MNFDNYECDGQFDFYDFGVLDPGVTENQKNNSEVKLVNDDCLVALKEISDESVDLVVTDCPYKIVQGGCTNDVVKIGKYSSDRNKYASEGKLFKFNDIQFSEWLPEVYRVLKNDTHCYIMINPRNLKELQEESERVGFKFQNILIWDKGNTTPNRYYLNCYEMILMLRKGAAKNINNMGQTNIIRIKNVIRNKLHPTEKPVELSEVLIANSSNENDTVLDPFMGAGGTGVAARKLKRNFIGIEIDEEYFEIAKNRIEQS